MKAGKTIAYDASLDGIIKEANQQRARLVAHRFAPHTLLVGVDVFMALLAHSRERLVDPVNGPQNAVATLYGMDVLCDPMLAPNAMRALPEPHECAMRRSELLSIYNIPHT